MVSFTKGQIVLFPFPFTDLFNRKLRPCLVLSDVMGEDVVLCQITSQKIRSDSYSVPLVFSETKNGSLKVDSYIRCNMLFTADISQIVAVVCELDDIKYSSVVSLINSIISK